MTDATEIRLSAGYAELRGSLLDVPAARDFAALLPLTVTDHAGTEKVSDPPARLSLDGSPPGTTARAGDICFRAPWGNLAIFYRDLRYPPDWYASAGSTPASSSYPLCPERSR